MALKVPNVGEVRLLDFLQSGMGATNRLRLYKNNHTPADGDTESDYTEADFSGYANIVLDAWGSAFLNGSNKGEIDETSRVFTHDSGSTHNTIYGYYVVNAAGQLLWAELNPNGPVLVNTNGQTYVVTPRLTLATES